MRGSHERGSSLAASCAGDGDADLERDAAAFALDRVGDTLIVGDREGVVLEDLVRVNVFAEEGVLIGVEERDEEIEGPTGTPEKTE